MQSKVTLKTIAFVTIALASISGCAQTETKGNPPPVRTLEQLINKQDPFWPKLQDAIKQAKNKIEVLPKNEKDADAALVETQVTTRSPMGAIVYETGGILVDHGWIRLLGSGSTKLKRSLPGWNKSIDNPVSSTMPYLLVADDVVGGFYAVNSTLPNIAPGHVVYFAPDSLNRVDTGLTYTQFVDYCLSGDIESFYKGLRWSGWEKEVEALDGDTGYTFFPFLWAQGPSTEKRTRGKAPTKELYEFFLHSEKSVDRKRPMRVKVKP